MKRFVIPLLATGLALTSAYAIASTQSGDTQKPAQGHEGTKQSEHAGDKQHSAKVSETHGASATVTKE
jgi:hypothetical protein